jgi:uroporphyrinogen decarboxylase
LIEVGVDILNPVQPLAMDPDRLKKRYGDRLSFWGAVDDQKVLPLGSPADVEAEVRLRLSQLAPGGGYILCPSHNVQPTTPFENIRAFYRAAERYRGYPLNV